MQTEGNKDKPYYKLASGLSSLNIVLMKKPKKFKSPTAILALRAEGKTAEQNNIEPKKESP